MKDLLSVYKLHWSQNANSNKGSVNFCTIETDSSSSLLYSLDSQLYSYERLLLLGEEQVYQITDNWGLQELSTFKATLSDLILKIDFIQNCFQMQYGIAALKIKGF